MRKLMAAVAALCATLLGDQVPSHSGTATNVSQCPVGMVLVRDTEDTFCIHAHEPSVRGNFGSDLQGVAGAIPPKGVVITSSPGVVPTVGYSFSQARAFCTMQGEGWHLATLKEWLKAAGQIDETAATANCNISNKSRSLMPTGSFPLCKSSWGAVDMVGNAWEWADPRANVSTQAFMKMAEGSHFVIRTAATGVVQMDTFTFAHLKRDIVGFANVHAGLDPDGTYVLSTEGAEWDWRNRPIGYLAYRDGIGSEGNPANDLPVEVVRDPNIPRRAYLRIAGDLDGQPITAKVGGAHYLGMPKAVSYGHTANFKGTILGRCVAPPIN